MTPLTLTLSLFVRSVEHLVQSPPKETVTLTNSSQSLVWTRRVPTGDGSLPVIGRETLLFGVFRVGPTDLLVLRKVCKGGVRL